MKHKYFQLIAANLFVTNKTAAASPTMGGLKTAPAGVVLALQTSAFRSSLLFVSIVKAAVIFTANLEPRLSILLMHDERFAPGCMNRAVYALRDMTY